MSRFVQGTEFGETRNVGAEERGRSFKPFWPRYFRFYPQFPSGLTSTDVEHPRVYGAYWSEEKGKYTSDRNPIVLKRGQLLPEALDRGDFGDPGGDPFYPLQYNKYYWQCKIAEPPYGHEEIVWFLWNQNDTGTEDWRFALWRYDREPVGEPKYRELLAYRLTPRIFPFPTYEPGDWPVADFSPVPGEMLLNGYSPEPYTAKLRPAVFNWPEPSLFNLIDDAYQSQVPHAAILEPYYP